MESWLTSTGLSPQAWAHRNRQTCLWFCMLWTWQNRTKNPSLNVLFLALRMAPQLETELHKRTQLQSPASTQIWPTWPNKAAALSNWHALTGCDTTRHIQTREKQKVCTARGYCKEKLFRHRRKLAADEHFVCPLYFSVPGRAKSGG